jgi:membrane protease subunit HflC
VKTFVRGRMRDVITGNKLAEVLRNDPDRKMQYPLLADLMASMEEASREPAAARPPTSADAAEADELPDEQEGTREAILSQLEIEGIEIGREEIVRRIEEIVRDELAESGEGDRIGRGIELVDVGIARIDFVDEVREAAFQRQIAFRQAIASWYENQGEQFKQEIINQTEAEVQKIEGDGKGEANRIKGEVEAEIMERYAQAIRETGEFYGFVRTLEAYQKAVGPNTRLVLTTDSQLFSLLKEAPPAPPLPTVEAPAEETATAEAADEKAKPKPPAAKEGPPEDEKSPAEKTSS